MIVIISTNVNWKSITVVKKATKVLIAGIMMAVLTVFVYLDFTWPSLVDAKTLMNVSKGWSKGILKRWCIDFFGTYPQTIKDQHLCSIHAECIDLTPDNLNAKYRCKCDLGYSGDGFNCLNIDECTTSTAVCPPNSDCIDTIASYECVCSTGFSGDVNCVNIDECKTGDHNCDGNAICIDSEGSFMCTCKRGYEDADTSGVTAGTVEIGTECVEANECIAGTAVCPENSFCQNTDASYECNCHDGYYYGDVQCYDINECYERTHNCAADAECSNTPGSYLCTCHGGFEAPYSNDVGQAGAFGVGIDGCIDIDECKSGTLNNCDPDADCINSPGSYSCVCREGWHGPGNETPEGYPGCEPILNCEIGRNNCHPDAKCIEIDGSALYRCDCNAGWHGDGVFCHDNDECLMGQHACTPLTSVCINVRPPEFYRCDCREGYAVPDTGSTSQFNLGGSGCQDFDECTQSGKVHTCDPCHLLSHHD